MTHAETRQENTKKTPSTYVQLRRTTTRYCKRSSLSDDDRRQYFINIRVPRLPQGARYTTGITTSVTSEAAQIIVIAFKMPFNSLLKYLLHCEMINYDLLLFNIFMYCIYV